MACPHLSRSWGHREDSLQFRSKNLNCLDRPGLNSYACCLLPRELRHVTTSLSLSFLICQVGLSVPSARTVQSTRRGSEHCLLPHPVPQTVPGHIFLQLIPPEPECARKAGGRKQGQSWTCTWTERCLCSSEILPGLTERQGPSKSFLL